MMEFWEFRASGVKGSSVEISTIAPPSPPVGITVTPCFSNVPSPATGMAITVFPELLLELKYSTEACGSRDARLK